MRRLIICIIATTALSSFSKPGSPNAAETVPEEYRPYIYADAQNLEWFEDARFGAFLCWGPSSLVVKGIGWSRFGPRNFTREPATGGIPMEVYDNLYKKMTAEQFDADVWIRMIRDAGAKYLIYLTKHHDGFCMFDAKNTDYKITNTPFGIDSCKAVAEACHKYGMKLVWYYSQPDWYHPDCGTDNHERYVKYMYEHIRQLLTDYGKIDGVWFDGLASTSADWNTPIMLRMIRTLQPGIIVNNRAGKHMPGYELAGDFDTPEQEFGRFMINRPWEMCATMGWGWAWDGGSSAKTGRACTRMLIQCAGSGGNLALAVGPRPEGNIDAHHQAGYLAVGNWLRTHGESIYETTGGPYKPGLWGVSTHKDNRIYLHILNEFANDTDSTVRLPMFDARIAGCRGMDGDAVCREVDGWLEVTLKKTSDTGLGQVVVLELDRPASEIAPIDTRAHLHAVHGGKGISSSDLNQKKSAAKLFAATSGDFAAGIWHRPYWAPQQNDNDAWVGLRFEEAIEFSYIKLAERYSNCDARAFELQFEQEGEWVTFFQGREIGLDFSLKTRPVKTQAVRLKLEPRPHGHVMITAFELLSEK